MNFLHQRDDFGDLISALGAELKISTQLVEKDYWIMQALWGIQDLKFDFELKGGTSLSKGWGCINRFSEDIDIQINPPTGAKVPTGKNQTSKTQIEERRKYFDSIATKIKIDGIAKVERDLAFDNNDMRSAGIRLYYPNLFGQIDGLKDGILLEVGFDQTTPNENRAISSWMMDKALETKLDVKDNRAIDVKCYVPEFTFVEKLQTVSTKFRQQQASGSMPANFIRHYYDLFQLLQLDRVKKFIGSKEYFAHKQKRFNKGDEPDLTKNEAFILTDKKTKDLYESSHNSRKNLYYKGQPDFESILTEFAKWRPKL